LGSAHDVCPTRWHAFLLDPEARRIERRLLLHLAPRFPDTVRSLSAKARRCQIGLIAADCGSFAFV
jgi:hypothetical protein